MSKQKRFLFSNVILLILGKTKHLFRRYFRKKQTTQLAFSPTNRRRKLRQRKLLRRSRFQDDSRKFPQGNSCRITLYRYLITTKQKAQRLPFQRLRCSCGGSARDRFRGRYHQPHLVPGHSNERDNCTCLFVRADSRLFKTGVVSERCTCKLQICGGGCYDGVSCCRAGINTGFLLVQRTWRVLVYRRCSLW